MTYGWKIGVVHHTEGNPKNPRNAVVRIDGISYPMGGLMVSVAVVGAVFACLVIPSPPFAFGRLARAVYLDGPKVDQVEGARGGGR